MSDSMVPFDDIQAAPMIPGRPSTEEELQAADAWLDQAPKEFVAFLKRLTFHTQVQWAVPDYIDGEPDSRRVTDNILETQAFSSRLTGPIDDGHALLLDLDVRAWQIPSTQSGHSHLYVNLPSEIGDDALWEFMEAAVKIGLIEEGYYKACRERGMTSLRAPWIKKN